MNAMVAMVITPIGARIVAKRNERDWSQGQLALYSGVEQTWLSNVEIGRTKKPDLEYMVKVARALNTTVEYLVTGRPPAEASEAHEPIFRRLGKYPPDMLARFERALESFLIEDVDDDEQARKP